MNNKLNGSLNGHENVKVEIYLPDNMNRLKGSLNGHADAPLPPSADGTATGGKDAATGRFLPGNKCGRGNPHYRRLAANRTAFREAVGPEQVKALAADLLNRALAGDVNAARLVLAYAVGQPQPAADPDAMDRDEWNRCQEWPHEADVVAAFGNVVFEEALRMRQAMEPTAVPVFLGDTANSEGRRGEAERGAEAADAQPGAS